MEKKKINGFNEKEIFKLYDFLKIYDDNNLKWKNEGEALEAVPALTEVKKVIRSFDYDEKKKNELCSIDFDSLDNMLYFTEYTSDLMGILYHLRNSIAHAKIEKIDNKVKISDYENKKNPLYTAKGIIDFEIIDNLLSITLGKSKKEQAT